MSWISGGFNVPIDRTARTDVVWVAIGPDSEAIVTTNVEGPRLATELNSDDPCVIATAPWWNTGAMIEVALGVLGVLGADLANVGSDGHASFVHDLTMPLTQERMHLSEGQQRSLADLGLDSAIVVESALRDWRPGEIDYQIAARIAAGVEGFGGQCSVILVGGDERVLRFRHPVAIGAPVNRLAMAVLVASRGGQHVALTRFASKGPVEETLATKLTQTRAIHRDVLGSCIPGVSLGQVMSNLAESYARHGHTTEWRDHYQGGPIGYAQRECEIAPVQTDSPWWNVTLPDGCAVAFNPSVAGGAKDEDTYILSSEGPRWITTTDEWPTSPDANFPRPIVLDIEK